MRVTAIVLLLSALVAPAIPAQTEVATQTDVTSLIPSNAMLVVYAPSWGALESKILSMGQAVGEKASAQEMVSELKGMLGPVADMVDTTKPLVLAVPASEDMMSSEPEPMFILPLKDPAQAAEAQLPLVGNYTCLSDSGEFRQPEVPSRLGKNMPKGDVVVRLDMNVLWQGVSKMLEMGMGDMIAEQFANGLAEGMADSPLDIDPDEITDQVMKGVTTFLSSSDVLDLSLALDGGKVALDTRLALKEGSAMMKGRTLSQGLVSKAKMLPAGHPVQMLVSLDWKAYYDMTEKLMGPAMAQATDEQAAMLKKLMTEGAKLYQHLGNDVAMSMDFGQNGLEVSGFMDCKDVQGYMNALEGYMKALTSMEGMEGQMPQVLMSAGGKIGDAEMRTMTMKFPDAMLEQMGGAEQAQQMMDTIFGKGGFRMNMVGAGKTLVMNTGSPDQLAKLVAGAATGAGTMSPIMKQVVDKAGQTPSFLMATDVRQVIQSVARLAKQMGEEVPDLSKVPSVPMGMYAGPDASGYRLGWSIDAAAMKKLAEVMDGM